MSDDEEIAKFIADRGVTVCPPAFVAETPNAALNRGPGPVKKALRKWVQPGGKHHRNLTRLRSRWVIRS